MSGTARPVDGGWMIKGVWPFATGRLGRRRGGLPRSVVTSTGVAPGLADHAMEVFLGEVVKRSIPYSPYANQPGAPVTHLTVGRAHSQMSVLERRS
jgi:3-hydroxy-9,10-secoandrosta-1,3,5(10)-triene-9,17-dione monooxygenase